MALDSRWPSEAGQLGNALSEVTVGVLEIILVLCPACRPGENALSEVTVAGHVAGYAAIRR